MSETTKIVLTKEQAAAVQRVKSETKYRAWSDLDVLIDLLDTHTAAPPKTTGESLTDDAALAAKIDAAIREGQIEPLRRISDLIDSGGQLNDVRQAAIDIHNRLTNGETL